MSCYEEVREKLHKIGQAHLLQYYSELSQDDRQQFLDHLNSLDYNEMQFFIRKWRDISFCSKTEIPVEPLSEEQYESEENTSEVLLRKYHYTGLEHISKGHVAALVLAGGLGTRLGEKYPKGIHSIQLLSEKCLFRIYAERILRLQYLAKQRFGTSKPITWYIMLSSATEVRTKKFFEKESFFGMEPQNVVFFLQSNTPCFKINGLLLLQEKNLVAQVPGGSGAVFKALGEHKMLEDMRKRGVMYVNLFAVDNILVKVADPTFLGYCIKKKAEAGNKVVKRVAPDDGLGVVCLLSKKIQVVEYTEISTKVDNLVGSKGELLFKSGNICNHFFTVPFLIKVFQHHLSDLKLHAAKRKIPYLNEKGVKFKPLIPECLKIERLISDVFEFCDDIAIWEVSRFTDFSVVRYPNSQGTDCPSTARNDLYDLHRFYVQQAEGVVHGSEIEISPLLSYAGEQLEAICRAFKKFDCPIHLTEELLAFIKLTKNKNAS